jgi:ADP-ribose pyrophosphatase
MDPVIPPLPDIELELLEDLSPAQPPGFLRLVRHRYRARYPDGSFSEPFVYDAVDRRALDAVVIAAHFSTAGRRWVYLRSAVRPPIALRRARPSPVLEPGHTVIWELPAGLVEPGEHEDLDGVRRCAARELAEELGFVLAPEALNGLGPSGYPAPGFVGERHFFFEVEVAPDARREPSLDGSPLERFGVVAAVPLDHALSLCESGGVEDEKSEIALRRLHGKRP